jgi:hypothetical protein
MITMFASSNGGENKTETKAGNQDKDICHAYFAANGFNPGYGFLNQNAKPFHQFLMEWMSFCQPCGKFLGQRGTRMAAAHQREDSSPLEAADVFF